MKDLNTRGYKSLAIGVVIQAYEDYKDARLLLENYKENVNSLTVDKYKEALDTVVSVRKFFTGEWFSTLCRIEGSIVLDTIDRQIDELIDFNRFIVKELKGEELINFCACIKS